MRTPGIVQRHPELRWIASVAVVGAVAVLISTSLSGTFRDDAALPATSAAQLETAVDAPHLGGYSGTIVSRLDLDLPSALTGALAEALPVGGTLLTGSHTLRYWYGGLTRQRVAVVGQSAEQDVFRNGTDLLLWDTRTRVAQRSTLPADSTGPLPLTAATPAAALTPPELADRLLDLAGADSDATLRSGASIADRATYELVVRPDSTESRIGEVHIEIDGTESVPLGVQVFAQGSDKPAIDVQFTAITFTEPAAQNFTFTPPDGAEIRDSSTAGPLAAVLSAVKVTGTSWTSVLSYTAAASRLAQTEAAVDALLGDGLRAVSGSWGNGRLLEAPLFSVLVTDKGRLLAGAVTPSVLYRTVAK